MFNHHGQKGLQQNGTFGLLVCADDVKLFTRIASLDGPTDICGGNVSQVVTWWWHNGWKHIGRKHSNKSVEIYVVPRVHLDSRHLIIQLYYLFIYLLVSRNSVVGTATGYELDNRVVGVRVPVHSRIFSSPRRPDRLWGSSNILPNEYQGLFPQG
jgi:hypothetical protein